MKAQMLKMAGVKSEKAFYKKFPTEEAFMKVHGKEFKKATGGWSSQPFSDTIDFENIGIGTMAELQGDTSLKPLSTYGVTNVSGGAFNDTKTLAPMGKRKGSQPTTFLGGLEDKINVGGKFLNAAFALRDEKRKVKSTGQWADVSKVVNQAANLTQPYQQHNYLRPEDRVDTGEEFFPINGVGTNVLKTGGEIQNTYSPKTLYNDLGEAQYGAEVWGQPATQLTDKLFGIFAGENAGGDLGGSLGGAIGSMFGPLGQFAGNAVGRGLGTILDRNPHKIKENQEEFDRNMGLTNLAMGTKALHNRFEGSMKNGGYMNPDYNPQLITKFGDIDVTDLHNIAHQGMDTLRTGGHIRQNQLVLGGDLQVYKGEAEPISQNPYLPEEGETVLFQGPSHEKGGMPIKFGNKGVEVEGGEPAVKLQNGGSTGENNLVVFGNLPIHNAFLPLLGDPDAKGKKFKNYIKDLSKKEDKMNTLLDKSTEELNDTPLTTSFDKLKFDGLKANILGANMTLKNIAQKKSTAASLQDAINTASEEHGLDAELLAKGVAKKAKPAKTAQNGVEFKISGKGKGAIDYNPIAPEYNVAYWDSPEHYKQNWIPKVDAAFNDPAKANDLVYRIENYSGQDADDVKAAIAKGTTPGEKIAIAKRLATDTKIGPYHKLLAQMIAPEIISPSVVRFTPPAINVTDTPIDMDYLTLNDEQVYVPQKKNPYNWMNAINEMIPYIRPTDAEHLDPRQLAGEMYALSTNQLEPVPAQTMQPQLNVPYDISYQDLLNKNQGDFRAIQRTIQKNPALASMIGAQKYEANQQVLGEQFRQNQAEKARVYDQNRQIINQTLLQNLGIMDKQYERQEGSKAATKATTLAALNSISDKFLKNQLENRTLQIGENTYNYRYDNQGRAINMNPLAQFNMEGTRNTSLSQRGKMNNIPDDWMTLYDETGTFQGTKRRTKDPNDNARNGAIVKALKRI